MPLITYYNTNSVYSLSDNSNSPGSSPIYTTHQFKLEIPKSSLTTEEKNSLNADEYSITGIVNTLPEISYSTSWDIGPIGVVSKKIEEFTNHKLFRAFAQNNSTYRPPITTDAWTQKMPKSAEPISFDLEFRSYPSTGTTTPMYNTSCFTKIIKFLIFATTPKQYDLSNSFTYTKQSYAEAKSAGLRFGQATEAMITAINKSELSISKILSDYASGNVTEKNKTVMYAIEGVFNSIDAISSMVNTDVGGAPLCTFSLGKDGQIVKGSNSIKWMIKNWSFKPAINVTYLNNKYVPIYVDFKISLESQMIFTNQEMQEVIRMQNI